VNQCQRAPPRSGLSETPLMGRVDYQTTGDSNNLSLGIIFHIEGYGHDCHYIAELIKWERSISATMWKNAYSM
jgi:hypothetical protein